MTITVTLAQISKLAPNIRSSYSTALDVGQPILDYWKGRLPRCHDLAAPVATGCARFCYGLGSGTESLLVPARCRREMESERLQQVRGPGQRHRCNRDH